MFKTLFLGVLLLIGWITPTSESETVCSPACDECSYCGDDGKCVKYDKCPEPLPNPDTPPE